ncbi:MAG: AlpA family transcriptional regulator [Terracidiphilus sp.]
MTHAESRPPPTAQVKRPCSTRFRATTNVLDRTGPSRSTVYQRVSEGRFPKPVSLGARAVGWVESDIEEWISRQIENSRTLQSGEPAPCSL